jgi:UDP-N-acetylmuramate dehydrogenase
VTGPDPALAGLARRLQASLGDAVELQAPLGPLTTYRVGGPASVLVTAAGVDELAAVARALDGADVDVLVVGKGSNLLVADAGFAGLAVVLGSGFTGIEVAGTTVTAGGAVPLPVLARRTAASGLTGLEWAVGVPGSVGGGVRMNAGGHGSDMARTLVGVRVLDLRSGEDGAVAASAIDLAYRHSAITADQVVVSATFALERGDTADGEALLGEIVRWRRANQPGGPNAGSVFTNPAGRSAGALIDGCGLKGLRVGTAAVSTKHANFIQADEDGRADDVYRLMEVVAERVRADAGVQLVPETRLVGFRPWSAPGPSSSGTG